MNTPRAKPGASAAETEAARRGRRGADPLGVLRLDHVRRRDGPRARPAGRRLLPVERRLRVLHPADPRPRRPLLPGQRRGRTRPPSSAPPTPTRGSGSSSRSATRSGCSPAATASPRRRRRCTAARPCAAGPARSHARRTAAPWPAACARGWPPGWAPGRAATASCSTRPAGRRTAGETEGAAQPFSLLMATYGGDDPGFLREAFASAVQEQTRRPDEVVLVQDGPVPDELADAIADLAATSPVPVKHLVIDANVGLGPALDAGLEACSHEIVARMDADDVSLPERFERQLPLVEAGADIVGSGLLEFGSGVDDVVGRRTPPDGPGRDPAGDPLPRPVQPPDGGLPAQRGARGRRLHRHGADGGLPAVHPDGGGWRAAGEPRRAAGLLPGRRGCLRAPRRSSAAARPS